ncbi:TetR/AcrR family transcriptional regulator [Variovorax sp. dw_308]|uniref:TetR/AcrR family transcriptional regulator n=1 Tax=Variovorax sp. dw_308 TaxID=2721546 RepID=UPI001C496957|nr:TetR/AcrR family transcriptional regulator [Variovorax sp. dw_308]
MKPEAKPSTSTAKVTPIAAGKQTPRRLRRAAEILAAARAVFLEKGFERASVGEIAARVGVVEGLVYTYFPTKRDLLNEVLRGMYEPLIEDIATSFARIHGLRSRLRFLVWRHLRVYVEEPSLSRIVLHEVRTSPEYFKSVLHDLHVRYTAFLLRTVHEAVDSGELPAGTDGELVRSMVYGGIEHRMWAQLFGRGGAVDVEAMADQFTALLLSGLLPSTEDGAAAQPAAGSPADIERRLARLERIVASAPADVRTVPTAVTPPTTVAAKQPVATKRRKARS